MATQPLNNYLRAFRKRSALTQREVARLLGYADDSRISRYESGDDTPRLRTIIALTILYGLSLRDLFPGEYARVRRDLVARARRLLQTLGARTPLTHGLTRKQQSLAAVVGTASQEQSSTEL